MPTSLTSKNGFVDTGPGDGAGEICELILFRNGLFDINGDAPRSAMYSQFETSLKCVKCPRDLLCKKGRRSSKHIPGGATMGCTADMVASVIVCAVILQFPPSSIPRTAA